MKRQYAEVGVKYWDNQDLLDLQTEPLKALDGFFAQYGPCVVKGCEITTSGSTFDIAPGLVVLTGQDHQKKMTTMIVPFEGASGTSLPVYLTLQYEARVREYGDGKVKPIAYDYTAKASTVLPQEDVPYLMIQQNGTRYFTDAIQDAKHRFVSDTEKAQWSAKETPAGAQQKADKALSDAKAHVASREAEIRKDYAAADASTLSTAKADASTKSEAALRSAKEYTDSREGVMRTNWAEDDASTLAAAKSYAEQVVAALVDGSPEALNTLQELAAALGNDPNFATTVMNEIGKRATTEAMNKALAGKLDKSGGTISGNISVNGGVNVQKMIRSYGNTDTTSTPYCTYAGTSTTDVRGVVGVKDALDKTIAYLRFGKDDLTWFPDYESGDGKTVYHSGNINPVTEDTDQFIVGWKRFVPKKNSYEYAYNTTGIIGEKTKYATLLSFHALINASIWSIQQQDNNTILIGSQGGAAVKIKSGQYAEVYADTFNGTATKALQDGKGNVIDTTYAKKDVATQSANGLMSATDKKKLDGLGVTSKCFGEISSSGGIVKATGVSKVTKKGTGQYEIFHPYGNSNFVPVVTIKAMSGDGNAHDNTPVITEMNPNSFIVYISTGAGKYEDTGFCFITMPI